MRTPGGSAMPLPPVPGSAGNGPALDEDPMASRRRHGRRKAAVVTVVMSGSGSAQQTSCRLLSATTGAICAAMRWIGSVEICHPSCAQREGAQSAARRLSWTKHARKRAYEKIPVGAPLSVLRNNVARPDAARRPRTWDGRPQL